MPLIRKYRFKKLWKKISIILWISAVLLLSLYIINTNRSTSHNKYKSEEIKNKNNKNIKGNKSDLIDKKLKNNPNNTTADKNKLEVDENTINKNAKNQTSINSNDNSKIVKIKKHSYYDQYGIDLNKYIINGMENKGINNRYKAKIEDWKLYVPPCPNFQPVHHSNDVLNPVCEDIAIPFYKISNKGKDFNYVPLTLRLSSITNQMKKWEKWVEKDGKPPNYREASLEELVDKNYHPFDYGYYDLEKVEDDDYYSTVVNSKMDRVPDPRKRRLFSMILFDTEFDLLDIYLSEYYEIVDYFIIYESNSTFSGSKKPLYLTRTLLETNRYEQFRDKIIPVTLPVVDEKNIKNDKISREDIARRQVIEKGLRAVHARHGDLYFHGNLNEMPKARLLSYLKKCGGWEHIQMGIGGGPKPIEDVNTKSYLRNNTLPVFTNSVGEYTLDYELKKSIAFSLFSYDYYFNLIENNVMSNFFHPNLAIFDARRSLGQYPQYTNNKEVYHFENNKLIKKSKIIKVKKIIKDKKQNMVGTESKNKYKNIFKRNYDDNDNDENSNYDSDNDYVSGFDKENNDDDENQNQQDNNEINNNIKINNDDIENGKKGTNNNTEINDIVDDNDFNIAIEDDEIDEDKLNYEKEKRKKDEYKKIDDDDSTDDDDDKVRDTDGSNSDSELDYVIDSTIYDGIDEDNDDPYLGYSYTDNTNFDKNGKGFLGEYMRFETDPKKKPSNKETEYNRMLTFWKSGWRMNSFYPSLSHFIQKLSLEDDSFKKMTYEKKKKKIIKSINMNYRLNENSVLLKPIQVKLPKTNDEKFPNMYSYKLWDRIRKEYHKTGKSKLLEKLNEHILHELPQHVWENPLCYSYMFDRNYGIKKRHWWENVPKSKWASIDLNKIVEKALLEALQKTQNNQYVKNNY